MTDSPTILPLPRGQWKVIVVQDDYTRRLRVGIVCEGEGSDTWLTKPTLEQVDRGGLPVDDPGLLINKQFLQAWLDAAWEFGLRPTGYDNVHEAIKATNAHLQDMRAIAFSEVKAPKP